MRAAVAPETPVTSSKATIPQGGKRVTEGDAGSNSELTERTKTQKDVKGGNLSSFPNRVHRIRHRALAALVSLLAVPAGMKRPVVH